MPEALLPTPCAQDPKPYTLNLSSSAVTLEFKVDSDTLLNYGRIFGEGRPLGLGQAFWRGSSLLRVLGGYGWTRFSWFKGSSDQFNLLSEAKTGTRD